MCNKTSRLNLKVVDGLTLDEEFQRVLRPGTLIADRDGNLRRLPRFFFEVESWEVARNTELAPCFSLWEFISVDLREAEPQRQFPRYVPCAVTLLAAHLSVFRQKLNALVYIAANGGYRSPGHALSGEASPHMWGTAANIYRIGDEYIDTRQEVERFRDIAHSVLPGIWSLPYGEEAGCTGDHLHLDIGFVSAVPPGVAGEERSIAEADPL
jgi:hypothetical protein